MDKLCIELHDVLMCTTAALSIVFYAQLSFNYSLSIRIILLYDYHKDQLSLWLKC